jgi:hypothetical protein
MRSKRENNIDLDLLLTTVEPGPAGPRLVLRRKADRQNSDASEAAEGTHSR